MWGDTASGGQAEHLREVAPHVTPRIQIKRPRGGVLSGMQRAAHRVLTRVLMLECRA